MNLMSSLRQSIPQLHQKLPRRGGGQCGPQHNAPLLFFSTKASLNPAHDPHIVVASFNGGSGYENIGNNNGFGQMGWLKGFIAHEVPQ